MHAAAMLLELSLVLLMVILVGAMNTYGRYSLQPAVILCCWPIAASIFVPVSCGM